MRLRLFDRVRRYIRPGPGGSRSRGSTRPGPPAVGGSVVVPPGGRHRRDHVPAPDQVSGSPASTPMTGGAGALDGGGPVEPAPQVELPRRVRRARTGPGRAGSGTEPSAATAAGAGTTGEGPRPARGHQGAAGHQDTRPRRPQDPRPPGPRTRPADADPGTAARSHRDQAADRGHRDPGPAGGTGTGPGAPEPGPGHQEPRRARPDRTGPAGTGQTGPRTGLLDWD